MPRQISWTASAFFTAAAAAISPTGLLIRPPLAQAIDCIQWGFPGDVNIIESGTGWSVSFSATGTSANVNATARNTNGEVRKGTLSGKIFSDDSVDITIRTPQGNQRYQGTVGADGKARGSTTLVPYQGKAWVTQFPLSCEKSPERPPPIPPPETGPGPAPAERPDRDGDGLFDNDETDVYGTNPDNADTDGDGSSDGQEVFDGTDPKG